MSDPNDLPTFLNYAWRHLIRGVADGRSPARYPTFATVAADGTPEARTVALRAASRSLSTLEVHTDIATAKVGAVRRMRTRIRLLAQPESMRSIVGATQQEQRFD